MKLYFEKIHFFWLKLTNFFLSAQNASICIRMHQNVCRMNCANVFCKKISKNWFWLHSNMLKLINYFLHFVFADPVVSYKLRFYLNPQKNNHWNYYFHTHFFERWSGHRGLVIVIIPLGNCVHFLLPTSFQTTFANRLLVNWFFSKWASENTNGLVILHTSEFNEHDPNPLLIETTKISKCSCYGQKMFLDWFLRS